MNKTELVVAIANDCEITQSVAEKALKSIINHVIKTVTKGETVQLVGFGSFSSGKRAARTGRNPRTGEPLKIAAAKTVKFTAGKAFKEEVNKKSTTKTAAKTTKKK